VFSVGANVDVTQAAGNEMESQVAVNPRNPNNIVVISQNDVAMSTNLNFSYSFDGGASWTRTTVGSAQDGLSAGAPRADARVIFDAYGNLYVAYMVSTARNQTSVYCLQSTNGGISFSTISVPVPSSKYNPDSPWFATGPDATNPNQQRVWLSFTDYTSRRVMVTGLPASDLGQWGTWSKPVAVSDQYGTYSCPAVGPNGELAVAWEQNEFGEGPTPLLYDVDLSGTGRGFGTDQVLTTTNVGGWDYIPAQSDRSIDPEIKLAFDRSGGPANGRLYVAYTIETPDESNNTDIVLQYSDDLGGSWSSPVRVNDDAGTNSQFEPALAVDQDSGNVALTWYDARNSSDNSGTQLFGTVSLDHGASFLPNVQIATGMSDQKWKGYSPNDLDYGDNNSVAYVGGRIVAVWSDNSNAAGGNPDGSQSKEDVDVAVVAVNA
jgi:hypothetical protein